MWGSSNGVPLNGGDHAILEGIAGGRLLRERVPCRAASAVDDRQLRGLGREAP